MRHDWVFDVLQDLKSYAEANGLPGLAAKVDEAVQVALDEVQAQGGAPVLPPLRDAPPQ